jgi:enamine deaminase RidA (YjgF/YER057c/UK114 family)
MNCRRRCKVHLAPDRKIVIMRPFRIATSFSACLIVFAFGSLFLSTARGQETGQPSIEYIPLDAPAGTSRAVIVQGHPLAHTRQLLALDREGQLVGIDSIDKQVEQVLDNLDGVLKSSGSGLDQLVRLNIYALAPSAVDRVREALSRRLDCSVRPALTAVLTPLSHRGALVAVDAVAVATEEGENVVLRRCEGVRGDHGFADAAVLPPGGVAYLSGVPAEGGLTMSAVDASMSELWQMLDDLKLSPSQVVQLKVFLRPASSADEVLGKLKEYFPNQMTPPVVFVEWLAPPPVEIELIAQVPAAHGSAPALEYYNPPDVMPMQVFSRAALVRSPRQIYIGGIFSRKPSPNQEQALDVFDQLQVILAEAGSDLRHMAKGTYYVTDDSSARAMDRARLWLYDQDRPPAASKCMVHGVGQADRKLTLDMIAVGAE